MKVFRIIFFSLVFLIIGKASSQDFNVFLQSVEEQRYYGQSRSVYHTDSISTITLTTMVNGITIDQNHLIKLKDIEVVDNKANSLKLIKSNFYYDNRYQTNKRLEITLEAPARNATEIEVQGSIQYFNPTEKNKGKVIIPDIMKRPGKNLMQGIYTNAELTYIDSTKLLNLIDEMRKMIDEQVEKRKEEVGVISEEEQREIEFTRRLFEDLLSTTNTYPRHSLMFESNLKIKDAYFSFAIFNAKGESISSGYSSVDNLYQYHLTEAPTEGCYIQILKEVDTAVEELKFDIKNIILP